MNADPRKSTTPAVAEILEAFRAGLGEPRGVPDADTRLVFHSGTVAEDGSVIVLLDGADGSTWAWTAQPGEHGSECGPWRVGG